MDISEIKIITQTSDIWVERGILHCRFFENSEITKEFIDEMIKKTRKLIGGKKFPVLADISHIRSISRESRKFISNKEGMTEISSLAILTKTPISNVIGNFLIGLNKPPCPVKLFNSKKKAVNWLKGFIK